MTLHLYANDVTDWFAAETLKEAKGHAVKCYEDHGIHQDLDDLHQVPDDKLLTYTDGPVVVKKTAAEFAAENGPGFWASSEF